MAEPLPSLALAKAQTQPWDNQECKLDAIVALQEELVLVTFVLPDDSVVKQSFKKGHTVAVLKSFLEDEYDLAKDLLQLYLGDQRMLDPLSLTDFPLVERASQIQINVRQNPRK